MTRSMLRQLLPLLCAVGLAAGCAAIPESSPVQVVRPGASDPTEMPIAAPPAGLDPLSVVRGFVEASVSQANRHAAARAYLADEAQNTWDDAASVVVLDDSFNTVYSTSPGDSQGDDYRQVQISGQRLGLLGADGAFTASRNAVQPTMTLVKQRGEWRISEPPDGLHIRFADFRLSYRSIGVKFVDPSRGTLVTDRRWVLAQPSSSWPSRTIELLLGGPSSAVEGAVVNELDGAKTRTNVVVDESDVLTVDLTGVPELSEPERRLAAAQIVGSLREVVAQPVRILADGAPLVPNKPEWTAADAVPFIPDGSVKPDLPALAVSGGRVVLADGGDVDGAVGDGSLLVESAAQSADGELFCVVSNDGGGPRMWLGSAGLPRPVPLQAAAMTRPTWRRGPTPEAWTVINNTSGAGVLWNESGDLTTFNVDLGDLAVKGKITELRLSRDGVRAAAIVDGALYVGVVVGSVHETKVRNARLLIGPGAAQLADVDWKNADRLVVVTRNKDNPQVYEVSVDGLSWTAYENTNLTGPLNGVAAADGRPTLVADQGGLWSVRDTNELWSSKGFNRGVDPVYPG